MPFFHAGHFFAPYGLQKSNFILTRRLHFCNLHITTARKSRRAKHPEKLRLDAVGAGLSSTESRKSTPTETFLKDGKGEAEQDEKALDGREHGAHNDMRGARGRMRSELGLTN